MSAKPNGRTKLVGVQLPFDVIKRLQLEAARTGKGMSVITAEALEGALPKSIKIVVGRDKPAE